MVNAVKSYAFSSDAAALILGPNDRNLSYLEGLMCTDLIVKGTSVAASPAPLYFTSFMERLEKAALERGSLSESEILMEFQLMMQPEAIAYSDARSYSHQARQVRERHSCLSCGRFQRCLRDIRRSLSSLVL